MLILITWPLLIMFTLIYWTIDGKKLDDEIANKINSVAPNTFTRFNDNKAAITFPKQKNLDTLSMP